MVDLGDLPTELLLNVVSYIRDRTTLRNLSLVSKVFHAVTVANLYLDYDDFQLDNSHKTLRLFLRTILNRPELARYVKQVAVASLETELGQGSSDKPMPLSRDDRKLYRDHGRSGQLARLKQFTAALSSGMVEAEVILLLSKAVNVYFLSFMAPPPTSKPSIWRRFLDQAASDLHSCPGS